MPETTHAGYIVDLHARSIRPGVVHVRDGRIAALESAEDVPHRFLLPGLIDAHVHVESSMLAPSEFARAAVPHGTVATVSDPHEIANVLGKAGVRFMLEDASRVPLKISFGAPSCVPATPFETAGAALGPDDVATLLDDPAIGYLSEMMNYPGVLSGDAEVQAKLEAAQARGLPVDGHAPGLRGAEAERYAAAGISTEHECTTLAEARDKLAAGMHILIRDGSAAQNFDALIPLMAEAPERLMFCTDDAHPDMLRRGHIDRLVRRALARGYNRFDVLRAACVHPVTHYSLDVGLLRVGDPADFIVVDDLNAFTVQATYIDGQRVSENGTANFSATPPETPNAFHAAPVEPADLEVPATGDTLRVIEAADHQLTTGEAHLPATIVDGAAVADPARDVLKLAVINRYVDAPPATAFVRGFGLERGAMASSVAHDSHNVIAVGANDDALARAINAVIAETGGISVATPEDVACLPLPIAGLMSAAPFETVATRYEALSRRVQDELGSPMEAPFMTLSFMALLVIPSLKLSDQGLFDGDAFAFTDVFVRNKPPTV
ncbi:adenine deaminase [Salisaeta longa]|uniref:adenine deaminase n=1 Tax=Salisaeta longa TaxID=503170 RepID=UPI0003B41D5E|nr:adenine deaminase [Salisaeta longa]